MIVLGSVAFWAWALERLGQIDFSAPGLERLLLARVRRPTGQIQYFKAGDDAAVAV